MNNNTFLKKYKNQFTEMLTGFIAVVILSVYFYGCFDSLKEPVSPSWDVDVNLPIAQRSYKLDEIIKQNQNPNLTIGSDSLYVYVVNNLQNTSPIINSIKLPASIIPIDLAVSGSKQSKNDLVFGSTDLFRLDNAEFKDGKFNFMLVNKGTSSINYNIKAPGFKKKTDNSILVIQGTLSAGEIKNVSESLMDYTYSQLPKGDQNSESTQKTDGMLFIAEATNPNDGEINFHTIITNSEIILSRLSGRIFKITLDYAEQSFYDVFGKEVDDFNSKIKFKGIRVKLNANTIGAINNFKISIDSLSVRGYNKKSNGAYTDPYFLKIHNDNYYTTSLIAGNSFEEIYDENNTSIVDFLTKFPNLIKVKNKFIIDNVSSTSSGTISDKDSVKINLDIAAPAIISVSDAGFKDTIKLDDYLETKYKDDITKSNNALVVIEVENYAALGFVGGCSFTDKYYNTLFTLKNSEDGNRETFNVISSSVDNSGLPTSPGITKIKCVLNKEEFEKFKDAEYAIVNLKLRSSGSTSTEFGPFVQIRAKDIVKFKIYGGVNYNLDPDNLKY